MMLASSKIAGRREAVTLRYYLSVAIAQRGAASTFDTTALDTSSRRQFSSRPQQRPIYVAATRQHVGKTSVSLALLSGLQRRLGKNRVGFMKPVGQKCVQVVENGQELSVDKDAAVIQDYFGLQHSHRDTSPVIIPAGYTRDYVNGKQTQDDQRERIVDAYQRISKDTDVVLCEGTGHCAVGSIVEASNAQVAHWLGASMVLVANGGLGNSFDELDLNRTFCERFGVDICGVVINKVRPDKYEQTRDYLSRVLKERHDIPLLGCVPDRQFLGSPCLADLNRLFEGSSLVSGKQHAFRHFRVPQDINLITTSLNVFLQRVRHEPSRTLYVCHASRNDILLGFLMEFQMRQEAGWEAAMVVTGCDESPISTQVLEIITGMPEDLQPPFLLTNDRTSTVMEQLYNYTPKLNSLDSHRVESTVSHYEPYIDFDLLLERVGYSTNTQEEEDATEQRPLQ